MNNEREALLRAILTDPRDDVARLVYADWLDEHDEGERAEFIRLQIEIARLEAEQTERFNDEIDWPQCTGVSANWCPNCGDCVCPNREESMCDDRCPLHSAASRHCCAEAKSSCGPSATPRGNCLTGVG